MPPSAEARDGRSARRPGLVAALVALAAALWLSLTVFHYFQLPRWSAWLAGALAGAAAFAGISKLARQDRPSLSWTLTVSLALAAAGTTILDLRPRPVLAAGALAQPLVVRLSGMSSSVGTFLLEVLSAASAVEPVAPDPAAGAPALSAPSLELTLESGDILAARLLDPEGELLWATAQPFADSPERAAGAIARGVGAELDLAIEPTFDAALSRLQASDPATFDLYFGALADWRRGGPAGVDSDALLGRLDQVLEQEPEFAPAAALRANVAFAAGLAIASEERSRLEAMDGEPRAHQILARLAAADGRDGDAREHAAEALRLGSGDAWIALDAALIEAWSGECGTASALAAKASALMPGVDAVRFAAAEIAFLCGTPDGAWALVEAAGDSGGPAADLLAASIHTVRQDAEAAHSALQAYESGQETAAQGPRAEQPQGRGAQAQGAGAPLSALAAYLYFRNGFDDDAGRLAAAARGAAASGSAAGGSAASGSAAGSGAAGGAASDHAAAGVTESLASMAEGDYLSALRTLRALRDRPIGAADFPLVVGIVRNAWMDPVLNEPAFRDVREELQLQVPR